MRTVPLWSRAGVRAPAGVTAGGSRRWMEVAVHPASGAKVWCGAAHRAPLGNGSRRWDRPHGSRIRACRVQIHAGPRKEAWWKGWFWRRGRAQIRIPKPEPSGPPQGIPFRVHEPHRAQIAGCGAPETAALSAIATALLAGNGAPHRPSRSRGGTLKQASGRVFRRGVGNVGGYG